MAAKQLSTTMPDHKIIPGEGNVLCNAKHGSVRRGRGPKPAHVSMFVNKSPPCLLTSRPRARASLAVLALLLYLPTTSLTTAYDTHHAHDAPSPHHVPGPQPTTTQEPHDPITTPPSPTDPLLSASLELYPSVTPSLAQEARRGHRQHHNNSSRHRRKGHASSRSERRRYWTQTRNADGNLVSGFHSPEVLVDPRRSEAQRKEEERKALKEEVEEGRIRMKNDEDEGRTQQKGEVKMKMMEKKREDYKRGREEGGGRDTKEEGERGKKRGSEKERVAKKRQKKEQINNVKNKINDKLASSWVTTGVPPEVTLQTMEVLRVTTGGGEPAEGGGGGRGGSHEPLQPPLPLQPATTTTVDDCTHQNGYQTPYHDPLQLPLPVPTTVTSTSRTSHDQPLTSYHQPLQAPQPPSTTTTTLNHNSTHHHDHHHRQPPLPQSTNHDHHHTPPQFPLPPTAATTLTATEREHPHTTTHDHYPLEPPLPQSPPIATTTLPAPPLPHHLRHRSLSPTGREKHHHQVFKKQLGARDGPGGGTLFRHPRTTSSSSYPPPTTISEDPAVLQAPPNDIINSIYDRQAKWLPLDRLLRVLTVGVVGEGGGECVGVGGREGVCLLPTQCYRAGGTPTTPCSYGYATCCVAYKSSCGSEANNNRTYWVSPPPGSHGVTTTGGTCTLRVRKVSPSVCHLRLDLNRFKLVSPVEGRCTRDCLVVSGQNINAQVPKLCGDNSGQHLYVDIDTVKGPVELSIITVGGGEDRSWEIKVSQIQCNSAHRPPANCLQYYTGTHGTFSSFNYAEDDLGANYLNNLNYAICIRKEAGFCSVIYTNNTPPGGFNIANLKVDAGGVPTSVLPAGEAGVSLAQCPDDYLVMAGTRLCGDRLNDATNPQPTNNSPVRDSTNGPFVVQFISNDRDTGRGFQIFYQQYPC